MHDVQILKDAGVRPTPIRLRVLHAVMAAGGAVPPARILEAVRCDGRADKVSVYRALDALVESGVVVRTSGPDRSYRYCMGMGREAAHGHFYCTECGRMECLDPAALEIQKDLLPKGATAQRLEVRVEGVCALCAPRVRN